MKMITLEDDVCVSSSFLKYMNEALKNIKIIMKFGILMLLICQ